MLRQIVDINAAIREYTAISVDVAKFGSGGNDALKSFEGMICSHAGHGFSLQSPDLALLDHARRAREPNLFLYLKSTEQSNRTDWLTRR
jgi:hypothetical protein